MLLKLMFRTCTKYMKMKKKPATTTHGNDNDCYMRMTHCKGR